jgi:hypothetical protein
MLTPSSDGGDATMQRWITQQAALLCQLDVLDIAMLDGDSSRMRSWLRDEAAYFLSAAKCHSSLSSRPSGKGGRCPCRLHPLLSEGSPDRGGFVNNGKGEGRFQLIGD